MKTFAIMLLMLCSFSVLKAQTMVVETADTVESFKVGEIKSLSAFEKQVHVVWVELKNIPIIALRDSKEEEYNYHVFLVCGAEIKNDTLIRIYTNHMDFTFFADLTESGSSGNQYESEMILNESNQIKRFYTEARGSNLAGEYPNLLSISGEFQIEIENLPFTITLAGSLSSIITGKDILKFVKHIFHKEVISDKYSESQIEFLKVLEEQLTDESILKISVL